MFDEKVKNAYKSIKAPAKLEERVLGSQKAKAYTKPRLYQSYRAAAALCACLLIVTLIATVIIIGNGNTAIIIDAKKVGTSPVAILSTDNQRGVSALSMDNTEDLNIQIEIKCSRKSEVRVSYGSIFNTNSENLGNLAFFDNDTVIIWVAEGITPETNATLSVIEGNKESVYVLSKEINNDFWTIIKSK